MKVTYDFAETKDTAIVFVYKPSAENMHIDPVLEGPRRLRLSENISIDLYGDVYPEIKINESKLRMEIHLRKVEAIRWGGIRGRPIEEPQDSNKESVIEDSEDEENTSVMDLFRKIYQRSGEDVRRAMEKSFYESEGTVLSTDWDQVKSKKITRED
ncbi:skp1 G2 allele suppressor-like protein [Encephalitozoon intestinalis ATCC 50506]|uniref:Skp1 G2 allele suppressor-like protein n=1 Tax=Encephalitozoon intestinalis (strain ATCC 50506) TaxID=876142 RepID=E0S6Y1_ENCIT|nr:skp1 G2 allele suppressor-like protein [Encephalitozoon intestinalis ATCC 50506]ADM11567.1 skp1 G2 allele suppressor-like protein [Encephalitozoon intestinalis ATCC 50506]UTX45282.1 SGS domain-containing protein [Encephalitozoon intestinalis]